MSATIDRPVTIDAPGPTGPTARRRVMGLLDVTLFIISAILVVDQLTASASIGVSAVGWWVLAIALFFIPSAMITAELATAYPEQGGIYAWVQRALGDRWAARTTYWYWVNVALWMPSVYLLFTGAVKALTWHSATVTQQSLVAIVLVWLTVLVGIQTLSLGKKVTNVSAVLKVTVIGVIIVGGIVLAFTDGSANSFTVSNMLPDFGAAKIFLPVLIYQLLGFELVSSMAGELKDPRRHIPRAIGVSGVLLGALYLFSTIGILIALPLKQIGLTEGLVDTFKAVFGDGSVFVWVLAIAAMATYFGNMVTWSLGANRSAVESANAGELPKLLATETRQRTPKWAFILTGIIATVVLLFAGLFIRSEDDLYFALFAASSAIFLLPYLLIYPAVVILRRKDPDIERPYRVPGGRIGLWLCTLLSTGAIAAAFVLFVWTPGDPISWSYTGPLIAIVGVTLVVGEIIVWACLRNRPTGVADAPAELIEVPR
jgi:amino acid transporter